MILIDICVDSIIFYKMFLSATGHGSKGKQVI